MRSSTDIAALLAVADDLASRAQVGEAETIYRQLLAAHPGQPALLHRLALVLKARGALGEAESLLRQAVLAAPQEAVLHNNLGNVLKASGRPVPAEACYRRAMALDPNYGEAHYNLGILLEDLARGDEALAAYRTAVSLAPGSSAARVRIGVLLHAQGRLDDALREFDASAAQAPQSFEAHYFRGLALAAMGRFDDATDALRHAAALKPSSHDALIALGDSLKGAGRHDEAIDALWQSIEIQPHLPATHEELNRLAWVAGRADMFLKSFSYVRERIGEDPGLLFTEAQIRMQRNDPQGAEPLLRRALVLAPGRGDANALLGRLMAHRRQFAASFEAFSTAVRSEPEQPAYRNEFGYALLKGGEPKVALAQFEEARRVNPFDQLALGGICLAYRALGDSRYHALCDIEAFVRAYPISPPTGLGDVRAYNAALAAELSALHTTKAEPLEQTLRGGTQTAGLLFSRKSALIAGLRDQIEGIVGHYVRAMPSDATHPFLSRRQEQFAFTHSWSCKLRSSGFHTNHVHPMGWISSAYYVDLPDALDDADRRPGWLKFGESHLELGALDRPEHFVRPVVGHLVLFPSYFWHGTVPFESASDRLTVAFDVVPGQVDPGRMSTGPY